MQAASTPGAGPFSRAWRRLGAGLARGVAPLGHAFGSIYFIPNPWLGLLLGLALASHPPYAAAALVALAVGMAMNRLLHLTDDPGSGGGVAANAMLAGIVIAWMTGSFAIPLKSQLLLAAAAAIPSALVAAALSRFLAGSAMPALLLGYCIVAAMLFAVCPQCTVAASNDMPPWPLPTDALQWGESLLRSLSSLMYAHDTASGTFVALAILLWSPTMFVLGVAAWLSGTLAALGMWQLGLVYDWLPLSYNYLIAGMALGAVVFLPSRGSLLVAVAVGGLTAFFGLALQYGLHWSAASYLPLSSALAIWTGIGALAVVAEGPFALRGEVTAQQPEFRWWQMAYWRARFGVDVPLFAAPVAGDLRVSQGFGGRLSHVGAFSHALDFQRAHAGAAGIWGAEITSPVAGMVERVRGDVPDNPVGICNYAEQWGNYVVIRLDAGGFAMLAHLQQGSVAVWPGNRVEVGSYLGRVGNSGRSSFAHLHMQLQESPEPGAPTLPFRLANYLRAAKPETPLRHWVASAVPAEGEVIMAAPRNMPVYLALLGMAPGSAVWTVEASGRVPRAFRPGSAGRAQRVEVSIDAQGRHVFNAAGEGSLVARLDPDAWRVIEVSPQAPALLRLLGLGASTVPYTSRGGMVWSDLPPFLPSGDFWRPIALAMAPYRSRPFIHVSSACVAESAQASGVFEVVSQLTAAPRGWPMKVSCTFSALKGPMKIRADFKAGSLTFTLLSYEPGGRLPAAHPP